MMIEKTAKGILQLNGNNIEIMLKDERVWVLKEGVLKVFVDEIAYLRKQAEACTTDDVKPIISSYIYQTMKLLEMFSCPHAELVPENTMSEERLKESSDSQESSNLEVANKHLVVETEEKDESSRLSSPSSVGDNNICVCGKKGVNHVCEN